MHNKMYANHDWWSIEKDRMIYFLSQLPGEADKTVYSGINVVTGEIAFKNINEIKVHLQVLFGIHNSQGKSNNVLLNLKQNHKPFPNFINKFLILANSAIFNEPGKIALLKLALHPTMVH